MILKIDISKEELMQMYERARIEKIEEMKDVLRKYIKDYDKKLVAFGECIIDVIEEYL